MARKLASHKIEFLLKGKNRTGKAFKAVTKGLKKIGKIVKSVGTTLLKGLAVGFTAVAVAMGFVVSKFAPFEVAITNLAQVTTQSLSILTDKILALDPALGNITDLTVVLYQTMSAGIKDPIRAFDLLTAATKTAKAAGAGLEPVVLALTKFMKGYGTSTDSAVTSTDIMMRSMNGTLRSAKSYARGLKDAADASDFLFKVVELGQTNIEELADVIGGLSLLSNNLGLSVNELGGSLAEISLTATNTAEASTRLRGVFNALLKPSDDLIKIYEKLRVSSGEALIKQKGFIGALKAIQKEAKRSGVNLIKLFGRIQGGVGVLALLKNGARDTSTKIREMANRTGKAAQQFEKMRNTLSGLWDTFKNTLAVMAARIGKQIAPEIKEAIKQLIKFLNRNKKDIVTFFVDIFEAILDLAPTATQLTAALEGVKEILQTLSKFWIKNGEEIREAFGAALEFIIDQLEKMPGRVKATIEFLDKTLPAAIKKASDEWNIFKGFLQEKIWGPVLEEGKIYVDWMTEIFTVTITEAQRQWKAFSDFLKNSPVFQSIVTEGGIFVGWIRDVAIPEFNILLGFLWDITEAFTGLLVGTVVTSITDGFTFIVQAAVGLTLVFGKTIEAILWLIEEFKNFGQWLGKQAAVIYEAGRLWGTNLVEGIIDGIKKMWEKIREAGRDTASIIADYLKAGSPTRLGPLSGNWQFTGDNMITTIIDGMKRQRSKLVNLTDAIAEDARIEPDTGPRRSGPAGDTGRGRRGRGRGDVNNNIKINSTINLNVGAGGGGANTPEWWAKRIDSEQAKLIRMGRSRVAMELQR